MRYLYYCNSTYQLLNILNLHWHRENTGFESIENYEADLMIQNSFEGASQIAQIIKNEKCFKSVFLVNKAFNNGRFHSFQTLMDLLSPSYYMRSKYQINKNQICNRYDVICAPKYSLLIDQIWRLNKNARLQLCEDGIGSYHLNILFTPRSKKYEDFRKLIKVNRFEDYEALYLVNKDMYIAEGSEKVIELPRFDKEYLEHIRHLFSGFALGYEEKDIYWLSQFLNNEEFNKMMAEVVASLAEYKDDVLFCQHPRTHMENIHGFAETDGKQIWELQILNMHDISKKLFVSIHSTACFTAKMLYDEEPYIIMFYRMGKREVTYVTDNFEEIVKRFAASYSDPSKIMLPENLDEFKECVSRYLRESKKG